MPEVSVIIPVYGVEEYIERCARSLFEQTLDDIEYIFVNDCTPDRSIEILETVLKDYPERALQTKILKTPVNSSVFEVRKLGLRFATGEYVIHCDSDDYVDRNMYKRLYEKAKSGDYDLVWCDYVRKGRKDRLHRQQAEASGHSLLSGILSSRLCGAVWNKMVKLSLYKDNNLIYAAGDMNEDLVIVAQLVYYAHSFAYVDEALYFYCRNQISITAKKQSVRSHLSKFRSSLANDNLVINFLKDKGVASEFKTEIEILKFYCCDNLRPVTHIKRCYSLWCSAFPTFNCSFLLLPKVPFKCKRRFLEAFFRCHKLLRGGALHPSR